MMNILYKNGSAAMLAFFVTACAVNPATQQPPAWTIENKGFSSTECVIASSSPSIDRKEALSKAQVTLAQQLKAKVKGMDKMLMEKSGSQVAEPFSSRSSVIIDDTLRGAIIQRQEYVNFHGGEYFCLQIAIEQNDRPRMFNALLQAADLPLSETEKRNLGKVYAADNPLNDVR